uniref:Uncharacterized protein n=1 Tax=Rhizophora mucronata TaxID=61149 RepID=A0A2P2IN34_RHIMU
MRIFLKKQPFFTIIIIFSVYWV